MLCISTKALYNLDLPSLLHSCLPLSFFSAHSYSQVSVNPESITSRGTIVLSMKFIPDGFEGQLSVHTTGLLY